jgi:hypothetical protein
VKNEIERRIEKGKKISLFLPLGIAVFAWIILFFFVRKDSRPFTVKEAVIGAFVFWFVAVCCKWVIRSVARELREEKCENKCLFVMHKRSRDWGYFSPEKKRDLPFGGIGYKTIPFKIENQSKINYYVPGTQQKICVTIHWQPVLDKLPTFFWGNETDKYIEQVRQLCGSKAYSEAIPIVEETEKAFTVEPPETKELGIEVKKIACTITGKPIPEPEPEPEPEYEEVWENYDELMIGVKNDEPIFLTLEDQTAHIQIIGASRFGKSKLIEYIARQFIDQWDDGLCLIDPNQQLYDDLLTWCIHRNYSFEDQRLFLLDPSDEKNTVGFNPFRLKGEATPQRIAARANRLLKTTQKALKMSGDTAIQAQRIIRCLYYVVIEQNLPITELKAFFTPRLFDRRNEIMSRCRSEDICDQWEMLTAGKKADAYLSMMQSSANRLFEFISEGGVQRLFTNPHPLDFEDVTKNGHIVFINLGKSDIFPAAARNVIGTFLIDEIWDVMSRRTREQTKKFEPFNLMVDEFQNFATPDFAEMLKEGAKYGLHLWLINHVLSDLDRDVKNALNACHTRIAFGGTMQQDAAFVLEGSRPREEGELKLDVELVPRLAKRRFMLRRQGKQNVVCDTPEVLSFPVKSATKEYFLNCLARVPAPEKEQLQQEPKISEEKTAAEPNAPQPAKKEKDEEISPDDLYF